MKEKSKIEIDTILQDEEFVNQIKDALDSESEMEILVNNHSEQKESLQYAIDFIKYNQDDQKKMNDGDFNHILDSIQNYSSNKKDSFIHRLISNNFWKVAVILVFFFSTSAILYYFYKPDNLAKIAQQEIAKNDKALIILSDGTSHYFELKETNIEYRKNGNEVSIKNDLISEVKYVNKVTSTKSGVNQIIVPYGHHLSLKLCDGSLVYLNAGSRLIFPAVFSGKNREVFLKGEGYFDVQKNPNKPFIVKTDYIDIKVLGTIFDISAYNGDQTISAVLVEGKVNVTQKNKLFHNSQYSLQPGQSCFYSVKNLNAVIKKVDLSNYILWRKGIYQFHNQPLKEIVKRIKKYYNISVVIDNDKLANTIVSGKLVLTDESEKAIEYLAKTLEAKYVKEDKSNYLLKESLH